MNYLKWTKIFFYIKAVVQLGEGEDSPALNENLILHDLVWASI